MCCLFIWLTVNGTCRAGARFCSAVAFMQGPVRPGAILTPSHRHCGLGDSVLCPPFVGASLLPSACSCVQGCARRALALWLLLEFGSAEVVCAGFVCVEQCLCMYYLYVCELCDRITFTVITASKGTHSAAEERVHHGRLAPLAGWPPQPPGRIPSQQKTCTCQRPGPAAMRAM